MESSCLTPLMRLVIHLQPPPDPRGLYHRSRPERRSQPRRLSDFAYRPNWRGFRDHRGRRWFHRSHAPNRAEFCRSAGNFAGPSATGWTGKNNAVIAGAKEARKRSGCCLPTRIPCISRVRWRGLWTKPRKEGADLLSYSPEQVAVTFAERAVMPVIFAELAATYPPERGARAEFGNHSRKWAVSSRPPRGYDSVGGHAAQWPQKLLKT